MTNKQALINLCIDTVNRPSAVEHFSNGKDANSVIREKFNELLGGYTDLSKAMRKNGIEVYEILEEVIPETYLKGVEENKFFMQFAEIRNIARGDSSEFFLEDDADLIVSEHSGTHWNISRQKMEGGTSFTVRTKAFALAVYTDFELFMTGRIDFPKLVAKIGAAVQRKVEEEVAASFAAGVTQLPAVFNQAGTYSDARLIELYSHVRAATGTNPVVVGTQTALAQITAGLNVEWYSDGMKDELNDTGRIGRYKGMTLVQLPQVHKVNTFEFAYDDSQLLVLPTNTDRFIKVVFEGNDLVKESKDITDQNDHGIEFKYITRFGVRTIFSSVFGLFKLSN